MTDFKECPLGGGNCDYTDDQILAFIMDQAPLEDKGRLDGDISADNCLNLFCEGFRRRAIRLVKDDQRQKPVADLGLIRRMGELGEAFEDFTLH